MRELDQQAGLLLTNCRSIHTLWMRFSIDVVFLNARWEVLEVHRNVRPWRICKPSAKTVAFTIELPTNAVYQAKVGDRAKVFREETATLISD